MKLIPYRGAYLNPEEITAISEITPLSVGSLHCDWEFGFVVHLKNTTIDFPIKTKLDLDGNHKLDRKGRKLVALAERKRLLSLINE